MEIGALPAERRDAAQGAILRAWLEDRVLADFAPTGVALVNPWEG